MKKIWESRVGIGKLREESRSEIFEKKILVVSWTFLSPPHLLWYTALQ